MTDPQTSEIPDEPMKISVTVTDIKIINGVLWADAIETGPIMGAMKGQFSLYVATPYAEAVMNYIKKLSNV